MSSKRQVPTTPDADGLPNHGAAADEGLVLRGRSKGVGVPVPISHPGNGGPPSRVTGGSGDFRWEGGQLFIVPSVAEAGSEFIITVEQ